MPRRRRKNVGRYTANQNRMRRNRNSQPDEQQNTERNNARVRMRMVRANQTNNSHRLTNITSFERVAFSYDPEIHYASHRLLNIGLMNKVCIYCKSLKFKNESQGMCCAGGKVKLPELNAPPEPLLSLLSGQTQESKHFLTNIRHYNTCFQMTSFGATNIIRDNYMPTFKIQGQIYHHVGSLLPLPDADHKFLQIYFMGNTNEELNQRCAISRVTKRNIVESLQALFHEHNELVRLFKTALERMPSDDFKVVIRADKRPSSEHERRFNTPTIDEVAIVIVGDQCEARDIILHRRNENIQRISETHRSYDALQYPIMFAYGEDGYHFHIKQRNPNTHAELNKKVSAMNFYAFRLMIRENQDNYILKCRQLFHQYIVDMYAKIETERLLFIRMNQSKLRSEEYIHLRDAVINDGNVNEMGRMVILPSTFTGSPRHMHEYAQDAMTFVRSYGRPDLFITFTCNPTWNEIKELLLPGQSPSDRHDITARVFKQKLKSLIDLIVKHNIYGAVRGWMYSIEWQKRGLPHAHILIWLTDKLNPNQIDDVISAEIPDKEIDPELFEIVTKNMIHGPCGALNPNSPCMVEGKCSKRYPRDLLQETVTGIDGYPQYRRRATEDGGNSFNLKVGNNEITIDNRWVVPYSPILSKIFNAHINVESCTSVKSIKYICKYVNKGSDMAVFGVANENQSTDEIERFQMGRYISSNEAVWRILSFSIHERYPTVIHLAVHLENGQRVYFTAENARDRAAQPPKTTLTEFFSLCQHDPFARTLLYSEIPKYYIWNASTKKFQRRKQGTPVVNHVNVFSSDALGRIYTIHPNNAECYYLRMLLVNVRGPTSFQNLKTVNGQLCQTYREACEKLGLLEDDAHWDICLADASETCHPNQIRTLFAIILSTCFPSNPKDLWDKYKNFMSEDILHRLRVTSGNIEMQFTQEIYNQSLIMLEDNCLAICNKLLTQLGMNAPQRAANDIFDRDLQREQCFDLIELNDFVQTNRPKLLPQQQHAYDTIIHAVENEDGGLFFLDAPGGTGKTFLISLILAKIRSQNHIALAIASSGIAATLLDGGRTAHSALKLPLILHYTENPICNITKNSGMGKVLKSCKLIVWDECTMAHKKSLEALNRSLQDLRSNPSLFGGALILLSGDFRQTLPVIQRSTPADELNACLKTSDLWRNVQKLTLTTNMRVQLQNDPSAAHFPNQLLDIGNGKIPIDPSTYSITLPLNFCTLTDSKEELIRKVFPNINRNYNNHSWLSGRAILAAKNIDVNDINIKIQNNIPGDVSIYKSIDTVMNQEETVNYPIEFLNSLDLPGFPPHILKLKPGVPIILLRNINPPQLCNGTRLAVKKLMNNVIEAIILTGKFKGENVLLPRIPMITADMPFEFKRLQFPVRLAFAMTINKAQGQSLKVCGLNLENPCFSHGQLYVACSRVGKPADLFIYAPGGITKNIVYPKACIWNKSQEF